MALRAKTNLLKDMKISEISLVTAPMCPEADVLFTKGKPADWRAIIKGDVQVEKADVAREPRDKQGRWTAAAIAAIGGKQGSYRRQVAQTFADKARSIASGTVAHTVSAVTSTRHKGANPVNGGGVQFAFEHKLADTKDVAGNTIPGARITSSVQIRPEHLGKHPSATPNKAQRALHTLHRVLHSFNRSPVEPFGGSKKFSLVRASVHPGDLSRSLFGGSGGGSPPPVAPTSDQVGGTVRHSAGGLPVWMASAMPPKWANELSVTGPHAPAPKDKEGRSLPHPEANFQSAGGQHYYRQGKYIPAARPDVQRGIEEVHNWLARNPGTAGDVKQRLQGNPNTSHGREFFNLHGEYVPPGDLATQSRIQGAYRTERDRVDTAEADRKLAREEGRAPADTAAGRLFGPQGRPATEAESSQGYDLGSADQQRAAREAFTQDRTRKSLFYVPPDFPVTWVPAVPHVPMLKWGTDRSPTFAVTATAEESKLAKARRRVRTERGQGEDPWLSPFSSQLMSHAMRSAVGCAQCAPRASSCTTRAALPA
ncbi:MAG: hypothetical protein ACHRHE_15635 [Tepidisphaerales bacterium]